MPVQKALVIVSVVLYLINLYIIANYSIDTYFKTRFFAVLVVLPFFIYYKIYKQKLALYVYILLGLFDVFSLHIENVTHSKIAILSRIVMYAILLFLTYKRLSFKVKKILPLLLFTILGLLNCYLLYELIDIVANERLDTFHKTISILCSILIVVTCMAAANYSFAKPSLKSTFFLVFVYCLSFADITSFCAYYLDLTVLFYTDRLLLIAAYFSFVKYAIS